MFFDVTFVKCTRIMTVSKRRVCTMIIAFITWNSNSVPLIEGPCSSNLYGFVSTRWRTLVLFYVNAVCVFLKIWLCCVSTFPNLIRANRASSRAISYGVTKATLKTRWTNPLHDVVLVPSLNLLITMMSLSRQYTKVRHPYAPSAMFSNCPCCLACLFCTCVF